MACGDPDPEEDAGAPGFETVAGTVEAAAACASDDDCRRSESCVGGYCRPITDTAGTDGDGTGDTDPTEGANVTDGDADSADQADDGDGADQGEDDGTEGGPTTGPSTETTDGSDSDGGEATTGPTGDVCRADADCFFPTPICLRAQGVCVECLASADCDSGESCVDNTCAIPGETGSDTGDLGCPAEKDCRGLECGLDPVCKLSCGTCNSGFVCQTGTCVSASAAVCPADADCTWRICGLDPVCGTSCGGDCGSGAYCLDGNCERGTPSCPDEANCDGRQCGLDPNCKVSCGTCSTPPPSKCIGSTVVREYTGASTCSSGGRCSYTSSDRTCTSGGCVNGACQGCTPACGGKQCGADGCGGSCGACNNPPAASCTSSTTLRTYTGAGTCSTAGACSYSFSDTTCSNGCANGQCKSTCTPACSSKQCGTDGCGGSCGTCNAIPANTCVNATTLRTYTGASTCSAGGACSYSFTDSTCTNGCSGGRCTSCTPACSGKQCGSDGCGGSCGTCNAIPANTCVSTTTLRTYTGASTCSAGGACSYNFTDSTCTNGCSGGKCNSCVPSCSGKQCGSDGCGGSCGSCNSPPANVCTSSTTLKTYSSAGTCSGSGSCTYNSSDSTCAFGCSNGRCNACVPQCSGKQCGSDGCGGSCGTCSSDSTCTGVGTCLKKIGCADGTAEGGNGTTFFMCQGNWNQPGVDAGKAPTCSRAAGNSGTNKTGTGCSASDLCAPGYAICDASRAVALAGNKACENNYTASSGFFAAWSSAGTKAGTLSCSSPDQPRAWLPGCNPAATARAALGKLAYEYDAACSPFTGASATCNGLQLDSSWAGCGATTQTTVTHTNVGTIQASGGVLCCLQP